VVVRTIADVALARRVLLHADGHITIAVVQPVGVLMTVLELHVQCLMDTQHVMEPILTRQKVVNVELVVDTLVDMLPHV